MIPDYFQLACRRERANQPEIQDMTGSKILAVDREDVEGQPITIGR